MSKDVVVLSSRIFSSPEGTRGNFVQLIFVQRLMVAIYTRQKPLFARYHTYLTNSYCNPYASFTSFQLPWFITELKPASSWVAAAAAAPSNCVNKDWIT